MAIYNILQGARDIKLIKFLINVFFLLSETFKGNTDVIESSSG